MQEAPPEGLKKLKSQLRLTLVIASMLTIAGRTIYISAECFRFDLIRREHVSEDLQATAYLYLAVGFTVLSVVFGWSAARRNFDLVKRAVWIHGTVEKISSLGKGGTRPVTFAYQVNGVKYKRKKDVPGILNAEYNAATRVWVIYDPHKPSRCEVLPQAI